MTSFSGSRDASEDFHVVAIPDEPDTGGSRDHYRYIQLARSTDHAAHWTKQDWRWWREDNLIIPTFLVYGKDNAGARDGYI